MTEKEKISTLEKLKVLINRSVEGNDHVFIFYFSEHSSKSKSNMGINRLTSNT